MEIQLTDIFLKMLGVRSFLIELLKDSYSFLSFFPRKAGFM